MMRQPWATIAGRKKSYEQRWASEHSWNQFSVSRFGRRAARRGRLVVAVEEQRFNRIKHGKLPDVDNPHQFPERAIRFCLDYAGLTAGDIDHVAYSFDPQPSPHFLK